MMDKEDLDEISSPEIDKQIEEMIERYIKNNPQFKNHYIQCLCKNNHYETYYIKPEDTLKTKLENSLARQFCTTCNEEIVWTNEVDPAINCGFLEHIPIMVELGNYENRDKYDRSLDVYHVPIVGTCKKTDDTWLFEVDGVTYESTSFDSAVKMVVDGKYLDNLILEVSSNAVDVVFANERLVEKKGFGKFSIVIQEKEKYYYYVF